MSPFSLYPFLSLFPLCPLNFQFCLFSKFSFMCLCNTYTSSKHVFSYLQYILISILLTNLLIRRPTCKILCEKTCGTYLSHTASKLASWPTHVNCINCNNCSSAIILIGISRLHNETSVEKFDEILWNPHWFSAQIFHSKQKISRLRSCVFSLKD